MKERWPNVKAVATTLREVKSTNRHLWSAVLWLEGKRYAAPTAELDVYDRVGGGDGFATGLFYGLLEGKDPREALALGWAHGALLTTFLGYHHGDPGSGGGLLQGGSHGFTLKRV